MLASVALVVLIGGAFAVLLVALDSMRDSGALARHSRVELSAADRLESAWWISRPVSAGS